MAKAEVENLAGLAVAGTVVALKVTPGARRNRLFRRDGQIRVEVTEAPERGRATEAAARLLAEALGVAPSRLTLTRGAASRDKTFRID
ncbi:DUF167 domain-containing protein [Frigidibacter sp. MR17.14]|uniref:DUF167 domain-containing protein n=1 Tax=Frigidibacter sp. MR17.14 TaxID=3126509 RepID=UPI0030131E00